ncbi:hypothetical protein KC614_02435, partial [candidate division WWE3 bacterium]|nr:hypothetical protein [candidate division WWE3 bacterium]
EVKDKKNGSENSDEVQGIRSNYVLRPRENMLSGVTQKLPTPLGNMYITVNKTQEGDFHEAFINLGLAGSDVRADTDAIGRLISLIFRLGSADSNQRMRAVIKQLEGISSGMVAGFNGDRVLSVPDAIAKGLKRVMEPDVYDNKQESLFVNEEVSSTATETPLQEESFAPVEHKEMCPLCGNYSVVMVEGCKKCNVQLGGCGAYSAC